jgi:phosphate-selective porin OprO and OprP
MKGKSALMAGVAAIAFVAASQAGYAAKKPSGDSSAPVAASIPAGPSNADLAARVQALEDELQANETKAASEHTRLSTLEQNFNYTTWTFDNGRPVINSGDGRFSMAFRVRFQEDFADFLQPDPTKTSNTAQYKDLSTGAVTRRAFLGVEGKAFNDFWYEFRYNAGGSNGSAGTGVTGSEGDAAMSIARVAYLGIPNFRINVGVIEPAFMLEGTTSSGQLMFLERPEIDNIAADSFGAGDARRGIEAVFQKAGVFKADDNLVLGAAYTGSKTGSSTGHGNGGDEQTQLLGHGSYRFWSDGASNAILGADVASILNAGGGVTSLSFQDRPEIRVDGTRLISAAIGGGNYVSRHAFMYAFNAAANYENFYVGGEYADFRADRYQIVSKTSDHPNFSGWYVEGSWVLTGEPKGYSVNATNNEVGGYGAPKVASPFSLDGESWGAWELVARYSDTDLDWNRGLASGIAGGREKIVDLGLNWYLNNEVKLQVHDLIVNVDKVSAPAAVSKYGQSMNVIGVRLQFSN